MKIGILQTGHAPQEVAARTGDYDHIFQQMLGGNGFEFAVWAVVDGAFPESADAADGWIITGSRHGAYEDHPWIPRLEQLIRDIHARGAPLVGICFGHQIIAQAMGGKVQKYEGGWSVGPTDYDFAGETFTLNAWHQDQVTEKPEMAQVIATTDFCANAGLLYDDRMFTVQPHPEFRKEFVEGLIKYRGPGLVPDEILADATRKLDTKLDSPTMADRIARFFLDHQAKTGAEKLRA